MIIKSKNQIFLHKAFIFITVFFLLSCNGTPSIPYPANNPDDYNPGAGWALAWSDEFDTFHENVWTRQMLLKPYNNEWESYTGEPSTAWAENGYLILKASWDGQKHGDKHYTSARVISNPGGQNGTSSQTGKTFLYGKIAARIQLPFGKGIWPAFWMLGDNISETGGDSDWPVCGEIDILEAGSRNYPLYGQGTISGALHHDPTADNTGGRNLVLDGGHYTLPEDELLALKFHVYEIEWTPESITWKIDGIQFGTQSITDAGRSEFHKPFYVIFNIAVGGQFTVYPDDTTPFPQYMYIDWIRQYIRK